MVLRLHRVPPLCLLITLTRHIGGRFSLRHCHGALKNARILLANPQSTEIGMPNMPSWKAKKLSKLPREKYS